MAKGGGRRLEEALRLLGADPATPDALTRADALWLARVLPQGDASASTGAQGGTRQPTPPADAAAAQPSAGPAAAAGGEGAVQPQADVAKAASDTTALFVQQPGEGDEPQLHARRVPVPAADALPGRPALERALRPFLRRRPSRVRRMVDAEATAEASAQASADALLAAGPRHAVPALVPVLRPVPERWFDMVLLAEQDDTMRVFDDTLRELRQLLARHGAFRRVGLWRWSVRDGTVHVQTASGMPSAPRAMLQGQHPQLVWVLTHGASTKWDTPELREFVRSLAARAVVAVVQLLPETAWDATALGESRERVRSRERAATNRQLLKRDFWTATWAREGALGVVPMLSLQADAVAGWAEFVMAPRALEHAAVAMEDLPAQARRSGAAPPAAAVADAAIRDQVLRFRAVASPQGFALLRLLSGAWITLPVMRLLLQSLPGPRALTPMAEVLLSGLLRRTSRPEAKTEELTFDFAPGVREWLCGSLSSDERRALDAAMAESKEAIRQFVETKLNRTMTSFSALLLDPAGAELLPASARSFVEVSRQLKALRGGAPAGVSAPAASVAQAPSPVAQPQPHLVRKLRILHLSDLHVGRESFNAGWRERRNMGPAWLENLSAIQASGPIDVVCMTGDVANSGRAEEYAEATHFVRELMGCLQLPMDRFFCVPGNHDIDRRINVDGWAQMRSALPRTVGRSLFGSFFDRQAAFRSWMANLGCVGYSIHQLGYRAWLDLGLGVPVCVTGLDSAWLAGDDSDEGHIRLGDAQTDFLLHSLDQPSISIALMHHPLSALADGEAVEHSLAVDGVTLLLHGHRHHPRQARWSVTNHGIDVSSAGGLYAPDSMPTSVNVLEVDVHPASADSPPRVGPTRFSSRVWSASGHWREGGGADLEAEAAVEPQAMVTQQVSPPSREAEQGPVFVGRSRELAMMCQALLPPSVENERPVFIGGPAGVGKTRLVQEFLEQYWRPAISALGAEAAGDQVMRLTLGPRAYQPSGIDELVNELVDQLFAQLGVEAPAGQRLPRLRAEFRQSPWLVVIEDVDTAEHIGIARSLAADLPGTAVVATGRAPVLTSSWMQIHLAPLSVAEACELLVAEGARRHGPPLTQTVAEELAHIAGYLPWALHLALLRWNEGATPEQIRSEFNERHADATPPATPLAAGLTRVTLDLSKEDLSKLEALAEESLAPSAHARSIYISAVNSEFGDYRDALQRLLKQGRIRVVTWENLPASGASSLLQLDDRLLLSDVVVHLVGDACGADPRPEDVRALMARYPDLASHTPTLSAVLAGDAPALSFTQWEAWLAHYHGLPQLVARALPVAPRNAMPQPDLLQLERQRRHLGMLERVRPVVSFSGPQELFAQVLQFLVPSEQASPAEGSEAPPLRVFLSHAAGDAAIARRLRDRLLLDGFAPWFAEHDLLPGQDWQAETTRALLDADVVLICLSSRSLDTGFAQQEMRLAVENAARQPEGSVYLIPVRLEPCDVPKELAQWHWVDYFADDGYQRLLRGLVAKRPRPQSLSPVADVTSEAATTAGPAPAQASRRPSIFLSYARENLKVVRKLVQRLERLGFDCLWFDVFEAHGTDDATARIEAALQACDHFMPVLSTTADQRPHGRYWEEWRWAIERAQQREGFLLPVGIDKRPPDRMDYKRIFSGATAGLAKATLLHAREGEFDDSAVAELSRLQQQTAGPDAVPPRGPRIYISHAHQDAGQARQLQKHMSSLRRAVGVEVFLDESQRLNGGSLDTALEEALDNSDAYVLLLSGHYLASEFCIGHEARRAMERMRTHSAKVYLVLLAPCGWNQQRPDPHPDGLPLSRAMAAGPLSPSHALAPLTEVRNTDAAWVQIVQRITETLSWESL